MSKAGKNLRNRRRENNVEINKKPAGTIITLKSGARYEVRADNSWKRIRS